MPLESGVLKDPEVFSHSCGSFPLLHLLKESWFDINIKMLLRWSHDCLVFMMRILIPGKMVFTLWQGPMEGFMGRLEACDSLSSVTCMQCHMQLPSCTKQRWCGHTKIRIVIWCWKGPVRDDCVYRMMQITVNVRSCSWALSIMHAGKVKHPFINGQTFLQTI